MVRSLAVLLALIALPLTALGQQCPNAKCQPAALQPPTLIAPLGTIDGSKSPELIPDDTAYRLFFVSVATPPNPTADQLRRQRGKLGIVQLTEPDLQILISTLSQFYVQYADFRNRENAAADLTRAQGLPINVRASGARRDALVQQFLDELKSELTPAGVAALDAHVQREKTRMKMVPVPNNGQ
jgi:hypothetical protein